MYVPRAASVFLSYGTQCPSLGAVLGIFRCVSGFMSALSAHVDITEFTLYGGRNEFGTMVSNRDRKASANYGMFSDKTVCPGPYLKSKRPDIAAEVNKRLIEKRQNV